MFCRACGFQNSDSARFCGHCGTPLQQVLVQPLSGTSGTPVFSCSPTKDLGQEARRVFDLSVGPIATQLRSIPGRGSSSQERSARTFLNAEIVGIIVYFSSIAEPVTDSQGGVFVRVCGTLQPSEFGRYSDAQARQFIVNMLGNCRAPDLFLYSLLQNYDQSHGTTFHSELAILYIEIATAVIAASGALSLKASTELERFKSILPATQISNIGQQSCQGNVVAQRSDDAKSAVALGVQDHNEVPSREPALSELDTLVLQDALNRERRAKAALRAVLQKNGCSEEQVETAMREVDDPTGLDGLVLQDALRREGRAKAALQAVMKSDGCSEEQIEEVMRSVDNAGDGDA